MLTQLLLKWNGYHLELQKGELADMFIAIASGNAGEQDLLAWIRAHIRWTSKASTHDRVLALLLYLMAHQNRSILW